jgi:hypothetical protein
MVQNESPFFSSENPSGNVKSNCTPTLELAAEDNEIVNAFVSPGFNVKPSIDIFPAYPMVR